MRPAETVEEPPVAGLLRQLEQSTASFGSEAGLLGSPDAAAEATTLPNPFPAEFRFLRALGGGAYGRVWLAEEIKLGGRFVALKTLRVAGDPARLAALVREAGILGRLEHRNLVRVHSWRKNGPEVWLVMQYVTGGSLEDRLERDGPLPWPEAARYVADVAEGLAHAHVAGVIHRDIKPGNILLDTARGEALLTDFGAAARGDDGTVLGTLRYMAPEAFGPGGLSPKLDVYSLAATLFRLLTGTAPYLGPGQMDFVSQAMDGLAADDPRLSGVPGPLEEVIRAGLTADPSARPGLEAFREALRGALNRLAADDLASRPAAWLHLTVERLEGARFQRAATTHRPSAARTRNLVRKQPPAPAEGVRLRTGDVVRVVVESERPGYVTVFNVGPTGDLNLLHPAELGGPAKASAIEAGRPVEAPQVEMLPPAGTERLFALWTARPLPLREVDLRAAASGKELAPSSAYTATRNMARMKKAVQGLRPEEWATAVLEVEHGE